MNISHTHVFTLLAQRDNCTTRQLRFALAKLYSTWTKDDFRFDALNTREDHENCRIACTPNLKDGTLSATVVNRCHETKPVYTVRGLAIAIRNHVCRLAASRLHHLTVQLCELVERLRKRTRAEK